MKKQTLTPVSLRNILIVVLLSLAAAGTGVFIFGYNQLKSHAASAQDTATKAEASRSSLQDLMATETFLTDNADAVTRADQLASESKAYVYQDQIINDLNKYASEAGIEIITIAFDSPTKSKTATATTPETTAAAPSTPTNVKSITATITIKNPTSYTSMLTFIHLIQQSLFRMQISGISMSQATSQESSQSGISSDTLTIEAYIR